MGEVQLGDNGSGRPALQLQAFVHEHHSGLSPNSVLLHSRHAHTFTGHLGNTDPQNFEPNGYDILSSDLTVATFG